MPCVYAAPPSTRREGQQTVSGCVCCTVVSGVQGWLNVATHETRSRGAYKGGDPMHPAAWPHLRKPCKSAESIELLGTGRSQMPASGRQREFAAAPGS